jgi:hypothetical protein
MMKRQTFWAGAKTPKTGLWEALGSLREPLGAPGEPLGASGSPRGASGSLREPLGSRPSRDAGLGWNGRVPRSLVRAEKSQV